MGSVNQEQAKALGAILRQRRNELGYTTYQVAEAAGVRSSTVVRVEQGKFAAPRPDKLARFAGFLDLSLSDLYTRAGYFVPAELPNFAAYVSAKYHALPDVAVAQLNRLFDELTQLHGLTWDDAVAVTEDTTDDAAGART